MNLEVLLSCMYQADTSLVETSKITSQVLLINQCDQNTEFASQRIRMISTTERGLSNSRNMALKYAVGEICILCDNDEIFEDNYETVICKAFERLPDADIIAFSIENKITKLPDRIQKIGKWKSLRIDSRQIAFRREPVLKSGVRFDPLMGAGSGNGAGEENLFLINCLKSGLTIYYVPETVAKLRENESTWFSGYNEMFFYQRGGATRYMLGFGIAFLYGIYYVFCKRALYQKEIRSLNAFRALCRGILDNRIGKLKAECL